MRRALGLVGLVYVGAAALVAGQFTPEKYAANQAALVAAGTTSSSACAGIDIASWVVVPDGRITTDPNYDDSVPADYGTVYSGADSLSLFPNGFRKGQIYENNDPPFCFYINSVKNAQVQVMIQTLSNGARLCIKDASTSAVRSMSSSINRCFTDKTTACFGGMTYSDTLTLVIYSDSTAATTATAFWYRVRTSTVTWALTSDQSANSAISTLEMWCALLAQDLLLSRFPKELRSVVPPDSVKTAVTSAAPSTSAGSIVATLTVAFAAILAVMRQ